MLVNAQDRFIDRFAATMLQATKKEGPIKAAFRTVGLPVDTRLAIRKRVVELKKSH